MSGFSLVVCPHRLQLGDVIALNIRLLALSERIEIYFSVVLLRESRDLFLMPLGPRHGHWSDRSNILLLSPDRDQIVDISVST